MCVVLHENPDFIQLKYPKLLLTSTPIVFTRTTDTEEYFVPWKVHQTKTESLYYIGFADLTRKRKKYVSGMSS